MVEARTSEAVRARDEHEAKRSEDVLAGLRSSLDDLRRALARAAADRTNHKMPREHQFSRTTPVAASER